MTEPRCEKTELLESQCAHCRGLLDPEAEALQHRATLMVTGEYFPAKYAGKCARCGDWFREGAAIRGAAGEPGWLAECCAEVVDGAA